MNQYTPLLAHWKAHSVQFSPSRDIIHSTYSTLEGTMTEKAKGHYGQLRHGLWNVFVTAVLLAAVGGAIIEGFRILIGLLF